MINIIEEKKLIKELFRDVIKEVIKEERISFYQSVVPAVSKAETEDIEERYGKPDDYKKEDFADMTEWVNGWKLEKEE